MTQYHTQSNYPDIEPTSPCPILILWSAWLGSDKYQCLSHWFDSTEVRSHDFIDLKHMLLFSGQPLQLFRIGTGDRIGRA